MDRKYANDVFSFPKAPPTFTTTPPQYVEAKEGGSTLLTCSAQGNPKPIISWLREGEELAASGKYKVRQTNLLYLGLEIHAL